MLRFVLEFHSLLLRLNSIPLSVQTALGLCIPLLRSAWVFPPLAIVNDAAMNINVSIYLRGHRMILCSMRKC